MYNVYGVICDTWAEACEVAGIETPAQLAAEDRYFAAIEAIGTQDDMEAIGGPLPRSLYDMEAGPLSRLLDDDIPF